MPIDGPEEPRRAETGEASSMGPWLLRGGLGFVTSSRTGRR